MRNNLTAQFDDLTSKNLTSIVLVDPATHNPGDICSRPFQRPSPASSSPPMLHVTPIFPLRTSGSMGSPLSASATTIEPMAAPTASMTVTRPSSEPTNVKSVNGEPYTSVDPKGDDPLTQHPHPVNSRRIASTLHKRTPLQQARQALGRSLNTDGTSTAWALQLPAIIPAANLPFSRKIFVSSNS
jgi:hypothetical protein